MGTRLVFGFVLWFWLVGRAPRFVGRLRFGFILGSRLVFGFGLVFWLGVIFMLGLV